MALIPFQGKDDAFDLMPSGERSLFGLRHAMDNLFDRFMRSTSGGGESLGAAWPGALRTDLSESDDAITVEVEAPGIDPKELEISVTGQTLTIRGEKRADRETKRRNYHFVERQFGSFQRSIPLPASVNADDVDARFRDGVLTITMPKRPDAKPRRITVQNASGGQQPKAPQQPGQAGSVKPGGGRLGTDSGAASVKTQQPAGVAR